MRLRNNLTTGRLTERERKWEDAELYIIYLYIYEPTTLISRVIDKREKAISEKIELIINNSDAKHRIRTTWTNEQVNVLLNYIYHPFEFLRKYHLPNRSKQAIRRKIETELYKSKLQLMEYGVC